MRQQWRLITLIILGTLSFSSAFSSGKAGNYYHKRPDTTPHQCEEQDAATASVSSIDKKFHLLSLEWTPDDDPSKFCKAVRDVWRWKDAALGDGRDFFVPKPRTLAALNSFLLKNSTVLEECVVLSNCARFEILLVASEDPTIAVSNLLLAQQASHKSRAQTLQPSFLDWPNVIDSEAIVQNDPREGDLSRHWTHLQGTQDVAYHLCTVAAGMARRPRRPNRSIIFQPFSARDAHIMLQLRRTLEVAQSPRLSTLLKYAIQAGKAARNVERVAELKELQKYGTGNSKYSTQPPAHVLERVTRAVMDKAVRPAIQACAESFQASEESARVSRFRSTAEAIAADAQELQFIRQRLHEPTIKLRKGSNVDTERILDEIRRELHANASPQNSASFHNS